MRCGKRIAVVVPAYNEGRLLAVTLRSMPRWVDDVVVVDDGSDDDTVTVARQWHRRCTLIRHHTNRGVGAALATGYAAAFARGADVAAVMAADAQMDPSDLAQVVAPVAEGVVDYCKGNRLDHPSCQAEMPSARRIGTTILGRLTRWLTRLELHDSQCGYTALGRQAASQLQLHSLWPGYGYPNDLLVRVAKASLRLGEVPVRPVYGRESSGLRWWHALFVIPFVLARTSWCFKTPDQPLQPCA